MKSISLADALKLGAVGFTGLFAGNAMYINVVDIPSKINLDIQYLLLSWKDAYNRAKKIQVLPSRAHVWTIHLVALLILVSSCTCKWQLETIARRSKGSLVLLGAACGYGAYYFEVPSNKCKVYLIASTALLSIWPWTLLVMSPDIGKLCEKDCLERREETWIREKIRAWNRQHIFRTVVSIASFSALTFALWVHG